MKNLIVCLGDSWTAGVVGKENGADLEDPYSTTWGRQLKQYLPYDVDITNMSLGGTSNTGAAQNLWLRYGCEHQDINLDDYDNVLIIFLMTVPTRICLYNENRPFSLTIEYCEDKSSGMTDLARGYFMFNEFEDVSANYLSVLSIIHLQNFCEAKGYKFLFGSAFTDLEKYTFIQTELLNRYINIENYIHRYTPYKCFREYLDCLPNSQDYYGITDTHHPSVKGNNEISKEIAKIIKGRNLI